MSYILHYNKTLISGDRDLEIFTGELLTSHVIEHTYRQAEEAGKIVKEIHSYAIQYLGLKQLSD